MADQKPSTMQKVIDTLGFDPTKRNPLTNDIMNEVKAELLAQKAAEAKVKATEVVKALLELVKKRTDAQRQFQKADAAFEKEMNGLLGQLNVQTGGAQPPADDTAPADPTPAS